MHRLTTFPRCLSPFLDDAAHRSPAIHQHSRLVIRPWTVNTDATAILPLRKTKTSEEQGCAARQNEYFLEKFFH